MSAGAYIEHYDVTAVPSTAELLATCTDVTSDVPPSTEQENAILIEAIEPGDETTSVAPKTATTKSSGRIRDAHASIVAVSPSTRVHRSESSTVHYARPNGTVYGFVDYRLDTTTVKHENTTITWHVISHGVESVTLTSRDGVVDQTTRTQTPQFTYHNHSLGRAQFELQATVRARLVKTVTTTTNNTTHTTSDVFTDNLTVSESLPVHITTPAATATVVAYPDDNHEVLLTGLSPWSTYTVDDHQGLQAQNVWQFYTAGDPMWETLAVRSATSTEYVRTRHRPLVVHAVPTANRPYVDERWGPLSVQDVAGQLIAAPPVVDSNVTVSPTNYRRPERLRLRHPDSSAVTLTGVVAGPSRTLTLPDQPPIAHRPALSITIVSQSVTEATLRVTLRGNTTGKPLDMGANASNDSAGELTVGGTPLTLNSSGSATTVVTKPGVYEAVFTPAAWVPGQQAYTSATATVAWHPLTTAAGLTAASWDAVQFLIPVGVVLFAVRQLGNYLS
ncbi:hypothetical protein [Haloferax sp. DFSO52]|uniref:hypothetical protein n=1 Tax=Haloferax sp. DFSO52 TaxID=3388505 RepID=UPI003A8526A1